MHYHMHLVDTELRVGISLGADRQWFRAWTLRLCWGCEIGMG